jgi:hypothetical protein
VKPHAATDTVSNQLKVTSESTPVLQEGGSFSDSANSKKRIHEQTAPWPIVSKKIDF